MHCLIKLHHLVKQACIRDFLTQKDLFNFFSLLQSYRFEQQSEKDSNTNYLGITSKRSLRPTGNPWIPINLKKMW